jgi:hypothetical protein
MSKKKERGKCSVCGKALYAYYNKTGRCSRCVSRGARPWRLGAIPYGYKLAANGKDLECRPDQMAYVSGALAMRANGATMRQIGAWLNESGARGKRGGGWREGLVWHIVFRHQHEPFYKQKLLEYRQNQLVTA